MKVLILGSGGREHALAWAVARSPRVTEIVCAPGNGGMAQIARCVPVDLKDLDAMVRLAETEKPDLTIVGPELPLSLGIVDALQERGLRVFGPTRAAAMLESSKGFTKRFLQRHNIPTANFAICATAAEAEKAADKFHPPIVVKADGLAAGKGVILCDSRHTAVETAQGLFSGALLGAAERQAGHRGIPRRAMNSASFVSAMASTSRPSYPRRTTSVSARATPDQTPVAWASTPPIHCSIPPCPSGFCITSPNQPFTAWPTKMRPSSAFFIAGS